MSSLAPLPVIIPLLVAAAIMAFSSILPRRAADIIAILTTACVAAICLILMLKTANSPLIYWFGSWHPRGGIAVGICFYIDSFGAGLAALVSILATASFVFSWHYFESVGILFHTLLLVFTGAMAGFCLSGDIFNTFVFFELMSITAYCLTAYKREKSPLSGSINFAVTNSIGAFLILLGISLAYGRTGALNFAQMGRFFAAGPADMLVIVSFVLITCGFFIKAALVPFHFWLSDAHAVAPTPVSVLFSGIMVELGLYGAARIYWTVFDGALSVHRESLCPILLGFGIITALTGGIMCFLQRHLKRLLAFSTISHMGVMTTGVALFSITGMSGTSIYLLGHSFFKASLFICVGILLHILLSVDEDELSGKGKNLPVTGVIFLIGGLGLAGIPGSVTHYGKSILEKAMENIGYGWVNYIFFLSSVFTGAAVIRSGIHIFTGWGAKEVEEKSEKIEETKETGGKHGGKAPFFMLVPAGILMCAGFLIGFIPGLSSGIRDGAVYFQDRDNYAVSVLDGRISRTNHSGDNESSFISKKPLGLLSVPAAAILALFSMFPKLIAWCSHRKLFYPVRFSANGLRNIHSGIVSDYVTWIILGIAAFGILLTWLVYYKL